MSEFKRETRVAVTVDEESVDLRSWARNYIRAILEATGIPRRPTEDKESAA